MWVWWRSKKTVNDFSEERHCVHTRHNFQRCIVSIWISLVVALGMLSLLAELLFLHVPSVASVYQLVFTRNSILQFSGRPLPDCLLGRVLQWPLFKKIVLLALPTALSVITGLLPVYYLLAGFFSVNFSTFCQQSSKFLSVAGMLLLAAGRVLTIYANLIIRKHNRQYSGSFELKTTGLFGYSRNPLLLGMYVFYAGMWLLYPTLLFAAGLTIYVLNMHFRVLLEEDFLRHHFGAPFDRYLRKTGRYLGTAPMP
jgi:protein-S-isoprenylcysteine O-methyltransferase Ste14